jgi:hypothetical protein
MKDGWVNNFFFADRICAIQEPQSIAQMEECAK